MRPRPATIGVVLSVCALVLLFFAHWMKTPETTHSDPSSSPAPTEDSGSRELERTSSSASATKKSALLPSVATPGRRITFSKRLVKGRSPSGERTADEYARNHWDEFIAEADVTDQQRDELLALLYDTQQVLDSHKVPALRDGFSALEIVRDIDELEAVLNDEVRVRAAEILDEAQMRHFNFKVPYPHLFLRLQPLRATKLDE